jgi:Na+-transporting methylmalonyl-CoA/oxaloacetate decarboxylase beta subunit
MYHVAVAAVDKDTETEVMACVEGTRTITPTNIPDVEVVMFPFTVMVMVLFTAKGATANALDHKPDGRAEVYVPVKLADSAVVAIAVTVYDNFIG